MSTRALVILIAVIVVLGTIAFLGQREDGGGSPSSAVGTPLVPALEDALNDIERVVVTKASDATVATLERGPDAWTVAEKDGYSADVAQLRQALVALGEARILEQKTSNPEFYARLGVEDVAADSAGGVAVALEGGRDWPTVILGDNEGSDNRYARLADAAPSYLIDQRPDVPRDTVEWLDRLVIDLAGPRVREVTIAHPGGARLVLRKPEAGATDFTVENIPEGRELLYAGVANVVGNALRDLRFEDVAPAEAAEPDPDSTIAVEYRTFDGLVVAIEAVEQEDDEHWISLAARYEPPAAAAGDEADESDDAAETDAAAGADGADGAADADATDAEAEAEAEAEAAGINARVAGWRYRIASYQFDPITRRMSDLLKPPEEE
jgi:hypothetical protein